ncbi:MAG: hypothetical protein AVDCRST_MAG93-6413, partial [uncultured Chloroflexia bacterium]
EADRIAVADTPALHFPGLCCGRRSGAHPHWRIGDRDEGVSPEEAADLFRLLPNAEL